MRAGSTAGKEGPWGCGCGLGRVLHTCCCHRLDAWGTGQRITWPSTEQPAGGGPGDTRTPVGTGSGERAAGEVGRGRLRLGPAGQGTCQAGGWTSEAGVPEGRRRLGLSRAENQEFYPRGPRTSSVTLAGWAETGRGAQERVSAAQEARRGQRQ